MTLPVAEIIWCQ